MKALKIVLKGKNFWLLDITEEQYTVWNSSLREIEDGLKDSRLKAKILGITDEIDIFNGRSSSTGLGAEVYKRDERSGTSTNKLLDLRGLSLEIGLDINNKRLAIKQHEQKMFIELKTLPCNEGWVKTVNVQQEDGDYSLEIKFQANKTIKLTAIDV